MKTIAIDTSKITPSIAEREEAVRLYEAADAADVALSHAVDGQAAGSVSEEELDHLERAKEAASKAYDDHPLTVSIDGDDKVMRCELSGIPIIEDDEMHTNADGERPVLTCLILPDVAAE